LLAATLLAVALGMGWHQGLLNGNPIATGNSIVAPVHTPSRTFSHESLLSLPQAAQGPVSAALGADGQAYRVGEHRGGFLALSPAQHLQTSFTRSGVSVEAGAVHVSLSMPAVGYGSALTPVGAVAPSAHANRVLYAHPGVSEWYANGPAGLEQGFTLAHAPAGPAVGPLTLAMTLSGNPRASLANGAESITFTRAGKSVLRYTGLIATDARGRQLHSWLQLENGRVLIRVDTSGAPFPVRIDPFVQSAELSGSAGTEPTGLGASVAVSGNTIVAGAPTAADGKGAVYVFVEPASGWTNATQTANLTTPEGTEDNGLGRSVAVSGNTIVAGAPTAADGKGAVYVFVEPASGWTNATQTAKLTTSEDTEGEFGHSVAISGNTIVAGAPLEPYLGFSATTPGSVYVFVEPASGWMNATQTAKLTSSHGGELESLGEGVEISVSASLGYSVAVLGNVIVAGAPNENMAYVFVEPTTGWGNATQTAELTGSEGVEPSEDGCDDLGYSVAISDNTIVAGAPCLYNDSPSPGAAYVFVEPKSGWDDATQTAVLTASDGADDDALGYSVAISDNTIVAGAPGHDVESRLFEGAVYAFAEPASGWANATQTVELTPAYGVEDESFGESVDISNDTIVTGASEYLLDLRDGPGVAYVFSQRENVPSITSPPTIAGKPVPGQTLTEAHGIWTNNPTSFSYQWLLCSSTGTYCRPIPGATDQSYVVAEADIDGELEVQETASNTNGAGAPARSTPTALAASAAPVGTAPPTISGTPTQGETLVEQHAQWSNPVGPYAYQWLRCNASSNTCKAIPGATDQAYVITSADVGDTIEVSETASNGAGSSTAEVSAATAVVVGAIPVDTAAPTISGRPVRGETLTELHGEWTNEPTSFSYQWLRCNSESPECTPILDATSQSYVVAETDIGSELEVQETAGNASGVGQPALSVPTAIAVSGLPVATAPPRISGEVQPGEMLTEQEGTWSNQPETFTYQWLLCNVSGSDCSPIPGATERTYTVTNNDIGATIEVSETASNAAGPSLPDMSSATGVVPVPLTGTVSYQGENGLTPVIGSIVQACTPTSCVSSTAETDSEGKYALYVPPNAAYTVTAFAPTSNAYSVGEGTTGPINVEGGPVTANVTLPALNPLPSGVTFNGQSDTVPTVYWGSSAPLSLPGCANGIGDVLISSLEYATGQAELTYEGLTETPSGSGTYNAVIPPFYPSHGTAEITAATTCPAASALLPNAGSTEGGTRVLISGEGFSAATNVMFGSTPAESFTVLSNTEISAVAPPGTGQVAVTITSPEGVVGSTNLGQYTYVAASTVSPNSGAMVGGTTVTITGSGLSSVVAVLFGDSIATNVRVVSDGEITATAPSGTGSVPVTVLTEGAGQSSANESTFNYSPESPSESSSTGFELDAGHGESRHTPRPAVFDFPAAPSTGHTSSRGMTAINAVNRIQAVAEDVAGDAGESCTIGTSFGSAFLAALPGAAYDVAKNFLKERIEDLEKTATTLFAIETLSKLKYFGAASALVDSAPYVLESFAILDVALVDEQLIVNHQAIAQQIDATLPCIGDALLGLVNGVQNVAASIATRVDPSGSIVDINGNPVPGATVTLLRSDTQLGPFTAVPSGSPIMEPSINPETSDANGLFAWEVFAGFYQVTATKSGCAAPGDPSQSAVSTPTLQVPPPQVGLVLSLSCPDEAPPPQPSVDSLSDDSGPGAGGTEVDIRGSGFSDTATVDFGGTPATAVTVLSPTDILATAPAGSGNVEVRVTSKGQTSAASEDDLFSYIGSVTVTQLAPSQGSTGGGTSVKITGTGFATGDLVSFGSSVAEAVTVLSENEILAIAPPGTGTVAVTVTNGYDTSTDTPADQYTYISTASVPVSNEAPDIQTNVPSSSIALVAPITPTASGGVDASRTVVSPSAQPASVCGRVTVDLLDAYISGGRLRLLGYANPLLAGQTVLISSAEKHTAIAHAQVATNGYFSASASPPPAGTRSSNSYEANIGGQRSSALALSRRIYIFGVTPAGHGEAQITGQLIKPLTARANAMIVTLRDSCHGQYARVKATIKLDRSTGMFTILVPAPPPDAPGAVYRLQAHVQRSTRDHKSVVTLSLPRPVS
jgi:hypothetical protein